MGTDNDTTTSDKDDETTDEDTTDWKAEAEKWKKLARKHEGRATSTHQELEKLKADTEGANRSDMEKLTATIDQLRSDLDTERRKSLIAEIANERGLSPTQAKRLTGKTREELEADADDMVEAFGIKPKSGKDDEEPDKGDGKGTEGDTTANGSTSTGKPKEKLRPGAAGESGDDDIDPAKIADSILKSGF